MPDKAHSVPAIVLPLWIKAGARCGVDIASLMQAQGITLDFADLADSEVSLAALDRVMDAAIAACHDAHFPFVIGETFAFDYLSELETFLTTSASLRQAAPILDWIPPLLNPLIEAALEEASGEARIRVGPAPGAPYAHKPYPVEMFLAALQKCVHTLMPGAVAQEALHLAYPPPAYAHKYRSYFRVPVIFEAPATAIVWPSTVLDRPLATSFPALHEQAAALAERRVAQVRRESIVDAVARLLDSRSDLLAAPLGASAAALDMQPRSLQRHLRRHGRSFRELQDEARYCKACRLLRQPHSGVDWVSEALGFSDRRSFTRAFRRWSGSTPSAFKRAGAGDCRE